jgi:uncharacterized protein (TIGR01319 family)
MDKMLLIDFGSTYTKVVAVDLEKEELLGVAQAPTSVGTDIMIGFNDARKALGEAGNGSFAARACSSAAGGLRMIAVGLVRELTAEAAKRAALGAGAKVLSTYAQGLSESDRREIEACSPDIILLAGGTDGGNRDVLLHNARVIAGSELVVPVVVAGNKMAADEAASIIGAAEKPVIVTENVMAELGKLNVEPARSTIRDIFMERIVHAKGLDGARDFVGDILMPTPMAVLSGARLLAEGVSGEPGLGELMVVDVGGATTDVYSVAKGAPTGEGVVCRGLPEPYAKRTVEGDLGIRYNAGNILEMVGLKTVFANIPPGRITSADGIDVAKYVDYLTNHTSAVPRNAQEFGIDVSLARTAVDMATSRHAGTIEAVFTPQGKVFLLYGKDLGGIKRIIGTGGVFCHGSMPEFSLSAALYDPKSPLSLRPRSAELLVDDRYILYGMGLLGESAPEKAVRMMKKHLRQVASYTGIVEK